MLRARLGLTCEMWGAMVRTESGRRRRKTHGDAGDGHVGLLEKAGHDGFLAGGEDEEGVTVGSESRGAAGAVNVSGGVFGAVELEHPVDVWKVEPAGGNVGAEEDGAVVVGE